MTLQEYTEEVIRSVGGGVYTDEQKFDIPFIWSVIHKARAVVARNDYKTNKVWNPSLIQYHYPKYNTYFQSAACITRFRLPTGFINGDSLRTGCIFVGSSNDIDGFNPYASQNFSIIKNRVELNDFFNHPRMTPKMAVLIEMMNMEVYSFAPVRHLAVGGVWDDPTAIPSFNVKKDPYPVSEDLFQLMLTYIKDSELREEAVTPPDTISDSRQKIIMPMNTASRINKKLL